MAHYKPLKKAQIDSYNLNYINSIFKYYSALHFTHIEHNEAEKLNSSNRPAAGGGAQGGGGVGERVGGGEGGAAEDICKTSN